MRFDMLRKSEFVRTMQVENDEYLAYHSLFGNLKTLNKSAIDLLNRFEGPKGKDSFEHLDLGDRFLDELREIYFLTDDAAVERQIVENELARRKSLLKTGAFVGGLQLSISDACNFDCIYCFAESTDKRSPERIKAGSNKTKLMSFETASGTIEKIIELVKSNGGESLVVKFFGREPMLNWKTIAGVVKSFKRNSQGINIHYSITSNGSLITKEVAKLMKDYNFQVTISIDGTEETNDTNRPLKNGSGSFSLINKSLKNLFVHKVNFDFSAVISDKNFRTFGTEFIDYAEKFAVKEIKLLFAMQGNYLKNENADMIVEKVMRLYKYGRARGVAVTGYWYNPFSQLVNTSKTIHQLQIVRPVQDGCAATGFQLSVEPSGDIFPCRAMSTYIGHISGLDKMLRSGGYEKVVLRTYGNVTDCLGCEIEGFCQGECLGNAEELFGDYYKIDRRFCRIYKKLVRELLLFETSGVNEKAISPGDLSENALAPV